MRRSISVAAMALGLAVAGCGLGPAQTCTEIGAPGGISVTVTPPLPADPGLTLTVCVTEDDCTDIGVRLDRGSDAVDQGCSGTDPDDVCSARVTPNNTLVGFADVTDLPTTPVTITADLTSAGRTVTTHGPVTVTPETTYPNGRHCPPGGNQAQLTFSGTR